jgi:hypothetical protein
VLLQQGVARQLAQEHFDLWGHGGGGWGREGGGRRGCWGEREGGGCWQRGGGAGTGDEAVTAGANFTVSFLTGARYLMILRLWPLALDRHSL